MKHIFLALEGTLIAGGDLKKVIRWLDGATEATIFTSALRNEVGHISFTPYLKQIKEVLQLDKLDVVNGTDFVRYCYSKYNNCECVFLNFLEEEVHIYYKAKNLKIRVLNG